VAGSIGQGEALVALGFNQIAWMDVSQGHPGVRKSGTFRPDHPGRYEGMASLSEIEYLPDAYAGAHAADLNSQALGVTARVLTSSLEEHLGSLAPQVELDNNALLDLDLVRSSSQSATAFVVNYAVAKGWLAPAGVVPPPPPPLPPPVPTPLPAPAAGLSTPEQRVDELWALVNSWWPTVRPLAIVALKMLRKAWGKG
jgi:hypothetical protein